MPGLIHGIEAGKVRDNLARIRDQVGPEVELLAATKYVPVEEMGALAEAGVTLVGENRLQDLEAKRERWGDAFHWDFIGNLQSRKVKKLLPLVPPDPLGRHRLGARPARPPRRARYRGPGRGQRRRRGGQGRRRPGRAGRFHRALPGQGLGADDDAPVQRGSGGLAAPFRPPGRARGRASTTPPFDGYQPRFRGCSTGGRDHPPLGNGPVSLGSALRICSARHSPLRLRQDSRFESRMRRRWL